MIVILSLDNVDVAEGSQDANAMNVTGVSSTFQAAEASPWLS